MIQSKELAKLRALVAERDRNILLTRAFTIAMIRACEYRRAHGPQVKYSNPAACRSFIKWATGPWGKKALAACGEYQKDHGVQYAVFSGRVKCLGIERAYLNELPMDLRAREPQDFLLGQIRGCANLGDVFLVALAESEHWIREGYKHHKTL